MYRPSHTHSGGTQGRPGRPPPDLVYHSTTAEASASPDHKCHHIVGAQELAYKVFTRRTAPWQRLSAPKAQGQGGLQPCSEMSNDMGNDNPAILRTQESAHSSPD